jgi:hypothetical protein
MALTFNVRGHWDEFAVAIRAACCQGLGHCSPSLIPSSTLSSTLVRRRHYHHLECAGICVLSLVTGNLAELALGTWRQRGPEHDLAMGRVLRHQSSRNAGKSTSSRLAIPGA